MYVAKARFLPILAGALTAVALASAPAFAGSDGSSGEVPPPPPAQTVPVTPAPVTPQNAAPVQGQSPESGGSKGERKSQRGRQGRQAHRRPVVHRNVRRMNTLGVATTAQQTSPQGAVQAGAGGTADQGPDGLLLGLAGGALALIATGGRLLAFGRRVP